MEVELREVPLQSAPSASAIPGKSNRRTMTLDLAANKPITIRLIYRSNGTVPSSPRSDGETSPGGAEKSNCTTLSLLLLFFSEDFHGKIPTGVRFRSGFVWIRRRNAPGNTRVSISSIWYTTAAFRAVKETASKVLTCVFSLAV